MRRTSIRYLLVFSVLVQFAPLSSNAQNITGIWRGYFITESFDQYKIEIQLKQTGSTFSGVTYSYLSTVFYGKATLSGSFNRTGQNALIREIKTVELKMSGSSQACIMKYILEYERSGKEEFLEGTFTSQFEKDGFMNKKGGNCGGGKVFLRKVTTSDFYIEPFLRNKVKTVPVIVNKPPQKIVNKPTIKKDTAKAKPTTLPVKKPVVVTKPVDKPITKITTPVIKPKTDTTAKTNPPVIKINQPVITPPALKNRTNELVKTIIVTDPEVTIKLYDNGEIDDDTISVYLDKKLVLSAKRLTAAPLVIKFTIDDDNADHELVMVAENLGRIPPNTSLMIVESGEQRFDARITSTQQKNAVVRFKYQKPK